MITLSNYCTMKLHPRRKEKPHKLCFILIHAALLFSHVELMLHDLKERTKHKYL